ncbi:MAG: aspartate kinase [Peptococcaceae bacterium]
MALIVQKFGGNSLNTFEKRELALSKITAARDKGYDVVVVVSALGRKGEPYATDTLIELLTNISTNPDPQKKDLLMSCGEIISAAVLAQSLDEKGYKSEAMTCFQAGIQTDDHYNNSQIINISTDRIKYSLEKGNIVVIAGFQGYTDQLKITTLGRGGSDITALALGRKLAAELVEIYTDVPGIAITDPRLFPDAPILARIDFQSMYVLACAGAKVIHPRAVKTAMDCKMSFRVLSTFTNKPGTIIGETGEDIGGLYGIAVTKNVSVLHTKYEGLANSMKNNIIDKLFYQKTPDGYALALQGSFNLPNFNDSSLLVSENCALVTMVWSPQAGLNARIITELLQNNSIYPQGFFALDNGGSWAIPAKYLQAAFDLIYNFFYKHQVLTAN